MISFSEEKTSLLQLLEYYKNLLSAHRKLSFIPMFYLITSFDEKPYKNENFARISASPDIALVAIVISLPFFVFTPFA
jgi:hypothetical protein